jgi:hypothetical protein
MAQEKMTWSQLVDVLGILWKVLINGEVGLDAVSSDTAEYITRNDPKVFARNFVMFLANGGRFILTGLKVFCIPFFPDTDRRGWTFWRGSKTGSGLDGIEDRDLASLAMQYVDLEQVELIGCMAASDERGVNGDDKHNRLKGLGRAVLGSTVSAGIWENYLSCQDKADSALERWYMQTGVIYVDFLGDVFRNNKGARFIQYFSRVREGVWKKDYRPLNDIWRSQHVTAVMKAKPID